MGCTESLPAVENFDVPFKIDPKFKPIGQDVGGGPSTDKPTVVVVKEKFFSFSGDDFKIKTYPSKVPFGNGLKVKGKTFALRDQMALLDGDDKVVAVCLRKFELIGQTFKIYVPEPALEGQKPSKHDFKGQKLYTYCEVKRVPLTVNQEVIMEGRTTPEFVITRAGSFWPKNRLVKKKGKPATLMEGGTWDGPFNSYKITCNPGIDPCLMICVAAICDEMDEQN